MKLGYWDLDVIHTRMKAYDIKYQEIYNELFDHIVSAIEQKREAGDNRSLDILFQRVVDDHFGGYQGIEKLAASYESEYKSKVKKLVWLNYRHYINLKSFLIAVGLILISYILPHTKLSIEILVGGVIILALYPAIYAYFKLKAIKPSAGKTSLVYAHVRTQALLPLLALNAILWVPGIIGVFTDQDLHYDWAKIPPALLALFMALILIYDLSCMRLCRQELKGFIEIEH